jgi:hypothetical protein
MLSVCRNMSRICPNLREIVRITMCSLRFGGCLRFGALNGGFGCQNMRVFA